jgi:hypothetical protein
VFSDLHGRVVSTGPVARQSGPTSQAAWRASTFRVIRAGLDSQSARLAIDCVTQNEVVVDAAIVSLAHGAQLFPNLIFERGEPRQLGVIFKGPL